MGSLINSGTPPRYAELRARTNFSFLRGASHPQEMVQRAAELGLEGLAITDRDGVYGIPKAFDATRSHPGLKKFITGAELTLEGHPHLVLLATDRRAYGLLCRMITASHAGREKGKAALAWAEFERLMERPESAGLIALPEEPPPAPQGPAIQNDPRWLSFYGRLAELFGGGSLEAAESRIFVPLARVLDGLDRRRTEIALTLSRQLELPIVATNDVHYHSRERRILQDVLSSTRENVPLDEAGFRLFSNGERYLKSASEMARLFRDLPGALEATLRIAERCVFSPAELRYRYPSEWIPPGESAEQYLERLTWEGARGRYPEGIPEGVRRQIEHEFKLIRELAFADYFLTIWEIVEFAKSRDILCQGRGSAANSVVCYCLGITAIDPVRMNLLFERFISSERGEPPDIDVDFEHERREEVIQHIYEKYGRDRAGMVSAVITYRSRSARRDIARALSLNPNDPAVAENEQVETLKAELKTFPRHLSIHSGGFTLSADPLIETVPVEPARMEGRTIVQWDKEDLAIVGLLKVDILALGMLSAIHRGFNLVESRYGKKLTIATIPPEDPKTYEMIRRADTIGVFQIESRAQMNFLSRLLPRDFYDLVVQVAIVRPGPIVGKMVHPYIRRRRGLESPRSPDPRLEPILGKTLGVPIFQEQVMKIAIELAGFTPGEADQLRRAIGAWRSAGSIEKVGRRLMEGLLASGIPRDFVERIFLQIRGFAEYGFPESHAASFALLAYASSYLKCHYPAEFTCSLLNSQPMGFYAPHTLVEDAKRHGVPVFPVEPNHSDWESTIEDDPASSGRAGIRLGWRLVSGMRKSEALRLIEERTLRPFRSLADFLVRTRLGPQVLFRLALGDAFRCFGGLSQREALWRILGYAHWIRPDPVAGTLEQQQQQQQLSLFTAAEFEREADASTSAGAAFPGMEIFQQIEAEYRAYGLSVKGHPLAAIRRTPGLGERIPSLTAEAVKRGALKLNGRTIRIAGLLIARQRPQTAQGTAFGSLEDETGLLDLIVRKDLPERDREIFEEHPFQIVTGRVQTDGHALSLIVTKLERLDLAAGLGEADELDEFDDGESLRVASRDFR